MRAFIAVDTSPEIASYDIAEIKKYAKVSIVKPENRHITLHFLGEISEEEAKIAEYCIRALDIQPINIKMTNIDTFRNDVVFIGGESEELLAVQNELSGLLRSEGFKLDRRPFRIHTTLCRVRSIKDKQMFANLIKTCQNSLKRAILR